MQDIKRNNTFNWPKVVIISNFNLLAKELVLEFVSNQCRVLVVSSDADKWGKYLAKDTDIISFVLKRDVDSKKNFDYLVLVDTGNKEGKNTTGSLDKNLSFAKALAKKNQAKALFVFPLIREIQLSRAKQSILSDKDLVSMFIYVGDLVSSEKGFEKDSELSRLIQETLSGREVRISIDENYYPINPKKTAQELVKTLFSFGFSQKELAIVSKPISAKSLANEIKKKYPGAKLLVVDKHPVSGETQIKRKKYLAFDISNLIESLKTNRNKRAASKIQKITLVHKEKRQATKKTKEKALKKRKHFSPKRKIVFIISALVALVVAPILIHLASFYSLGYSKDAYLNGSLRKSKNYLSFSIKSSSLLGSYFSLFSSTPLLRVAYRPLESESRAIKKTGEAGQTVLKTTNDTLDLLNKVLNSESYDVDYYLSRISLDLDFLYKQLGFLESELLDSNKRHILFRNKESGVNSLKNTRENLLIYKKVVGELAGLLGNENPKAYLILLQDEDKLRPTGGQITAFSIINFNQGRKSGVFVASSDSADQQLSGQVEPPYALERYLQKEKWSFKESNWDVDFSASAQKAEWFLEKELGQSVDGVLAMDFTFLESLYRENILSSEAFDELRNDTSLKKFLGEGVNNPELLLNKLIEQMGSLDDKQKIKLAQALYKALEEKHVQLFINNSKTQRSISEMGFAGEIQKPLCNVKNCYSDLMGVVEANFSESFLNSRLKRDIEVKVNFEEGLIKRSLLIIYKNLSGSNGGEGDAYKTYIRVLANGDSGFAPVTINEGVLETRKAVEVSGVRGHKEAGVYVEVAPGETKTLVFSWESASPVDFSTDGKYLLTIRKQPGTDKDGVKSFVSFPVTLKVFNSNKASLTQGNTLIYNTELLRDFSARIFW